MSNIKQILFHIKYGCVQRQMRQPAAPEVLGKGLKNQLEQAS